ncbi:MAG: MMPL family transporter [Phycisphaerae bacterium]
MPGNTVYRLRWPIVCLWVAAAAGMGIFVPPANPGANEPQTFLPVTSAYMHSMAALRKGFPGKIGLSDAVVVFERRDGELTDADKAAIERVADRIGVPGRYADARDISRLGIRSPGRLPFTLAGIFGAAPPNPLISPYTKAGPDRGQAALIIVSVPYNFVAIHSANIVEHIQLALAATPLPKGLTAAITGASGFGRDYGQAATRSSHKTLWVTVAAVIIILMVVYRAPVAALIPLMSIGMAGVITAKLLTVFEPLGLHAGTAEQIFVFVLLWGAGTDYSLLFISRFREFLDAGQERAAAASAGLNATLPAILASSGTNIAGLLTLLLAQFEIFRTTGPAVTISLVMALLASITLTPALVGIIGPAMFWPRKRGHSAFSPSDSGRHTKADELAEAGMSESEEGKKLNVPFSGPRFWSRVAAIVAARPALIIVISLAILVAPAARGLNQKWVYDTLADLPPNTGAPVGNAVVGLEMVKRHWPVGFAAPVTVLVQSREPLEAQRWAEVADRLSGELGAMRGVSDVWTYTQPLGELNRAPNPLIAAMISARAAPEYLGAKVQGGASAPATAVSGPSSARFCAMRLSVILDQPALTLAAMDRVKEITRLVDQTLAAEKLGARVTVTGATAEMAEVRAITQRDFHRIALAALGVIYVIVLVLMLDALLALFMVASTVLSYMATLGACHWVFAGLLGQAGLDWKVEVFLFVVMIAVGQDYNIFLASRLAQEGRKLPPGPAVRRAVAATGPVISSCGVIMAATLGSLMAGELGLLKQLGFAFALGMLIDTFLVRPLLLPSFAALTRRTGKAWGWVH